MSRIFFINSGAKVSLPNRKQLKLFLVQLFRSEKLTLEKLSYIFCSDDELLKINQRFLKHEYYTDIITFDLSSRDKIVDGEIYISMDRVRENAPSFSSPIYKELHRVMFHGALHLCGYDDSSVEEKKTMRKMEDKLLDTYFYSNKFHVKQMRRPK